MSCKVSKSHEKCLSPDSRVFWPKTLSLTMCPTTSSHLTFQYCKHFPFPDIQACVPEILWERDVELATVMRLWRESCFQLRRPWWTESSSLVHWVTVKKNEKKGGRRKGKGKGEANQIAQRSALVLIVLNTVSFCIRPFLLYTVCSFSSYVARKHLGFHYETSNKTKCYRLFTKANKKDYKNKRCKKEHSKVESLPDNGQKLT